MSDSDAVASPAQLRRAVLAAVVLDDLGAEPGADGVTLDGSGVTLSWPELAAVLAGWAFHPEHPAARRRLLVAVDSVSLLAEEGPTGLRDRVHAHAEPALGSALHAGPTWAVERVPGGALDVGYGISDLPVAPGPSPLPPLRVLTEALGAASQDQLVAGQDRVVGGQDWVVAAQDRVDRHERPGGHERLGGLEPRLHADLDRLAGVAVERLERDQAEGRPLVLRPVGEADVVTLLASPRLRAHLAEADGTGMRAVAVPVRSRGWFDVARIDVAYTGAAWLASASLDRAFERPLLVTRDEVSCPGQVGDVAGDALADPAGPTKPRDRDVRHR